MEEKTEEELTRIAEKRKEQGKKLQEMAAKSRMEKVTIVSFDYRSCNPMYTDAAKGERFAISVAPAG